MANIKNFQMFLNENNSKNIVNSSNFLELKDKILPIVAMEENPDLKKGFDFTLSSIADYKNDEFVRELSDIFFDKLNRIIDKKYTKFWKSEDRGYSGNKFTGKNYDLTQNMDIKELAKLVKKELSIEFPDWKFSVKISRYSGGQSMSVHIVDMPYTPYSEIVDNAYKTNTTYDSNRIEDVYNEQYLKDSKKIKHIVEQYNYDDSNAQIDYFNVRYYSHITLDGTVKAKFYPENEEVKKHQQWDNEWKERAAKKKAKAEEVKKQFKFKKGEEVIYIYDKDSPTIPKGEYDAVILKAPNGRAMFAKYDIKFAINKRKLNGEIKNLEKPIYYTTTLYGDDKLKEKGA